MNFRKPMRISARIDMTPMVDIVFLLVIFFMVTTTFILNPSLKIELPESKTADAQPAKDIIITIGADGTIWLNKDKVSLDSLPEKLKARLEQDNKDMIVIKGDKEIKYQVLIGVMDAARSVGINKINLATDKK